MKDQVFPVASKVMIEDSMLTSYDRGKFISRCRTATEELDQVSKSWWISSQKIVCSDPNLVSDMTSEDVE